MSVNDGTPAAGLILAAGAGTRFGVAPKQLADLCGRPLLQWAVDAQTGVDRDLLSPIVVVLGAHAERVRAAIDLGRAQAVVCPEWATGLSASLACGLRALTGAPRIVVTLGDAPLLSGQVVARFAALPPGTRAVYDGRPGHPVVLGAEQIAALTSSGATDDEGARRLLAQARLVEAGPVCCGRDVDTPQDLEEVRDEAATVF